MPRITAIEPQKKKEARFNLYVDYKFATGVRPETLAKNNLSVGQNLSGAELAKIILGEEQAKLMDKVLRFLSTRPKSEREVKDYLTRKISDSQKVKFSQAKESFLLKKIIAKLKDYKYINDREFTKWWLSARISAKKGPRLIKYELLRKGINRDIVESTLTGFKNQTLLARAAIEKKLNNWQKLPGAKMKQKVYQYLISRGFEYDTAKEVFAQIEKKR